MEKRALICVKMKAGIFSPEIKAPPVCKAYNRQAITF